MDNMEITNHLIMPVDHIIVLNIKFLEAFK